MKKHVFVQMVLNNLQFHRKKFSTALLTKGTLRINFSNDKFEINHPDTAERKGITKQPFRHILISNLFLFFFSFRTLDEKFPSSFKPKSSPGTLEGNVGKITRGR